MQGADAAEAPTKKFTGAGPKRTEIARQPGCYGHTTVQTRNGQGRPIEPTKYNPAAAIKQRNGGMEVPLISPVRTPRHDDHRNQADGARNHHENTDWSCFE